MTSPTPGQVLIEVYNLLKPVLVPTYVDIIYPYRTLPNLLPRYVALSYTGGLPAARVTGGEAGYYDFVAALVVQFASNDALETAENGINDLDFLIWQTLYKAKNYKPIEPLHSGWLNIEFIRPSIHPPAPPETPKSRYGEVYFRVNLR